MAGTVPTITGMIPALGKKMVYFAVTLDGSAKADFTQFTSVNGIIWARDATNLQTAEAETAISGVEVTFTNNSNAIVGVALVTE